MVADIEDGDAVYASNVNANDDDGHDDEDAELQEEGGIDEHEGSLQTDDDTTANNDRNGDHDDRMEEILPPLSDADPQKTIDPVGEEMSAVPLRPPTEPTATTNDGTASSNDDRDAASKIDDFLRGRETNPERATTNRHTNDSPRNRKNRGLNIIEPPPEN